METAAALLAPLAAHPAALTATGAWLCLASAATYVIFSMDRRRAAAGLRRVPEGSLLWLSVFGGWPGALAGLRACRGLRFSDTFRGWLRAIVAAELLFLGLALVPQGAAIAVAEGVASLALGEVTAAERRAQPGRIVLDSARKGGSITNVVPLSGGP